MGPVDPYCTLQALEILKVQIGVLYIFPYLLALEILKVH